MKKLLLALLLLASPAFADGLIIPPSLVGTAPVGQVPATQTNDNACSTCIGYVITNTATSVVLTTAPTVNNVNSITLLPGDWMVNAAVNWIPASGSTVMQYAQASINTGVGCSTPAINATVGFIAQPLYLSAAAGDAGGFFSGNVVAQEIKVSANTTACVTLLSNFSGAGLSASTKINAWRIR